MMNTRGSKKDHQWSNLPNDLLTTIADRLHPHIDVLRSRAVCTSWRSSFPPFPNNSKSPRFPIEVPDPHEYYRFSNTRLTERTLYRLEPLHEEDENNSNNSAWSKKGWLVKVEEWKPGHFHVFNPLSKPQLNHVPNTTPKKLNMLDYRVFELGKSYSLKHRWKTGRAIFSKEESAVLLIYGGGRLAFLRLGDDKWSQLDVTVPTCSYYTDIMLYKGKFYAIDNWGLVVVIDYSTLKLTKVWHRIGIWGNNGKFKFLQSSGSLYIIDPNSASFQIYKLHDAGWVVLKSLGDQVAFLGKDFSFLALAEQFVGCKGNCIYYSDSNYIYRDKDNTCADDELKGLYGHNTLLVQLRGSQY